MTCISWINEGSGRLDKGIGISCGCHSCYAELSYNSIQRTQLTLNGEVTSDFW